MDRLKQYSTYLPIAFSLMLVLLFSGKVQAQTNLCQGSLLATTTIGNYGAGTQIGNGTPGSIRICLTTNNLVAAGMGCSNAQFVISNANGSALQVIWTEFTPTGTCFTVSSTTGFAFIAMNCETAGSTAGITWTTVNGSGVNQCVVTCTDGLQNGNETGVDCGGTFCVPCTCTNGILDPGETGIDCGGPCDPCGTCFDGIQNGSETGVDCGGSCALICSTNGTPVNSSCGPCPPASVAVVYPTVCDQVGTSAYNLNSPTVNMISCGSSITPVPAPPCAPIGSEGTWIHVDLAPTVTQVQLAFNSGSVDPGNSNSYAAAYQGPNCSSLTPVAGGCQNSVQFISGTYNIFQNFFTGLDPSQDLWIFMFNDAGKPFNLNYNLVGTTGPPSNTSCATASTAIGDACNLGAQGASFTTPGAGGFGCSGGNWGSNENTTFYSFTADATTGSLDIQSILCNDGTAGNAQFGVWTSCAAIGTYGANFLGCAVGTATISLSPLIPGQTYYIAADGFAGDNCAWTFSGTGIVLPIELGSIDAVHTGRDVHVEWTTITEKNNDYFSVQRTLDGLEYSEVGIVLGAGTSTEPIDYYFIDDSPYAGKSYYRIKQVDYDGEFSYSELVSVYSEMGDITVERTFNLSGQEVGPNYSGMVIDFMSDGSTRRRIQM